MPNCQITYAVTHYDYDVGEILVSHGYCPECGRLELEKIKNETAPQR
jgi:hypothetical protein